MSAAPLLSIIVPTYNRAETLSVLLEALAEEGALSDDVELIIGDNASTDGTEEVVAAFCQRHLGVVSLRHDQNLGPDENFCRCIERSHGAYFWIFGDDDLPRATLLSQVLMLLRTETPDLLSLSSEWVPKIAGTGQGGPLGRLTPQRLSREAFAARVHVWTTFISGIVVRRQCGVPEQDLAAGLRRHTGTHLVQLAWVFGALKTGKVFLHIPECGVLATSGNTGGYALLRVFGANFPRIIEAEFASESSVSEALLRPHLWGYLPNLIWDSRFRHLGAFEQEQSWMVLRDQLGNRLVFWVILTPLLFLPRPFARPFLLVTRLVGRLQRQLFTVPA